MIPTYRRMRPEVRVSLFCAIKAELIHSCNKDEDGMDGGDASDSKLT